MPPKRVADAPPRHIIGREPPANSEERLRGWTETDGTVVEEARVHFGARQENDPAELARERRLADEYVSVRLLEFLAGVERALRSMLESRAPHADTFRSLVDVLEAGVADALELELGHRQACGSFRADAGSAV